MTAIEHKDEATGNLIHLVQGKSEMKVMLYLKGKNEWRKIWKIRRRKNGSTVFTVWRSIQSHYYRASSSFGFNHYIVEKILEPWAEIRVKVMPDNYYLKTTREYLLENWHFLHFKDKSFELQIFLNSDKFLFYWKQ